MNKPGAFQGVEGTFTIERLKDLSWLTRSLKRKMREFRWSGFKEVDLESYKASILTSIPLFSLAVAESRIEERENFCFTVIIVMALSSNGKKMQKITAVPVKIDIFHETKKSCFDDTAPGILFNFKNGIVVVVNILTQNARFWKDFLFLLAKHDTLGSKFQVHFPSPEFKEKIENLARDEYAAGLEIAFLGDSNTTNIVMRLTMKGRQEFNCILKAYPLVNLNPSVFLNEMLRESKYSNYSKLFLSCNHAPSFLERILPDILAHADLRSLTHFLSNIQKPASFFFPFLQVFEFINAEHDGGYPFWISATECVESEQKNAGQERILELSKKLGYEVAKFHASLSFQVEVDAREKERVFKGILRDVERNMTLAKEVIQPQAVKSWFDMPLDLKVASKAAAWLNGKLEFQSPPFQFKKLAEHIAGLHFQYIHQDLHLAQFMHDDTRDEFIILDLEGDPQLNWLEKVSVYPVEKDLASLTRSLSYIKIAALREKMLTALDRKENRREIFRDASPLFFVAPLLSSIHSEDVEEMFLYFFTGKIEEVQNWVKKLNSWESLVEHEILESYSKRSIVNTSFYEFFKLTRLLDEIAYEARFRPRMVLTPLAGLIENLHREDLANSDVF